jgi:hypothetical protein
MKNYEVRKMERGDLEGCRSRDPSKSHILMFLQNRMPYHVNINIVFINIVKPQFVFSKENLTGSPLFPKIYVICGITIDNMP